MFGAKMPRKFAIFAAISECLIYAEGKYCAFEIHGEPKYYVCQRTEYCCNFGCCPSPGFQIYRLWYYWLLVIIMFLVCSGGGWWYRYWLQGRYRAAASALPPRQPGSRTQNSLRGSSCQAQQARVTFNPARNTVLLHRMWKGPQRSATPPAYNGSPAAASSRHFQNTNVVLTDNSCPYYQLYGPPPSYETVIAQTRGKILSPTSPEHPRTFTHPTASPVVHTPVPCFAHPYSPVARWTTGSRDATRFQNGCPQMESYAGLGFAQLSPGYGSERFPRPETAGSPPAYRNRESPNGCSSPVLVGSGFRAQGERDPGEPGANGQECREVVERHEDLSPESELRPCELAGQGIGGAFDVQRWELCSFDGSSAGARGRELESVSAGSSGNANCVPDGTSSSQRNPSNNVILPSSSSVAPNDSSSRRINIVENYQYYPPSPGTQRYANANSESERKLDRSRSLE